ncbi:MAG TPA: acyltransferase [Chloroflexota bacterium]|nr:acyltransferase [Chloroflexota bacterium]
MKLEAVRGFAALYVVVHHARPLTGSLAVVTSFGQEAVILFFLLSGFVVYYSSFAGRSRFDLSRYLNHRFRRIYPLFLIALAVSYLCSCLVRHALLPVSGWQLAGNLALLQDVASLKPGVWVQPVGGDAPLWSLSYEWWFYVLFIPISLGVAGRVDLQRYLVFIMSLAAALVYQMVPNEPCLILAYLVIWWTGVEFAREYARSGRVTFRGQLSTIALLGAIAATWALPVVVRHGHGHLQPGVYPLLPLRHFGMALTAAGAGVLWSRVRFVGFRFVLGPFALVAPISYGLYIIHYPILTLLEPLTILPALRLALLLAVAVPLAWVMECCLQPRLNVFFDRLLPDPKTPVPARLVEATAEA